MRRVHCAGCGATEDLAQGESSRRIVPVTIAISDDRKRSWEHDESYSEDLCPDCTKAIVARYFSVKVPASDLSTWGITEPPIIRAVG